MRDRAASRGRASGAMTAAVHEDRIKAALRALLDAEVRTVLDLGGGAGASLRRLLDCPQLGRIDGG